MPLSDLLYVLTVLLLAYFVRGISGFGSGLIAVPLLALKYPLTQVVPFMLVTDLSAAAMIGGVHLRHMERGEIRRLLPPSLLGVAVGTTLLVALPAGTLLAILAGLILLFALRFIFMRPGPFTPISPHWAYPAALTGGAVSALFGTGGPPYVIYLSHRLRDKGSLRATLSGLFFLEGLIRIVALLLVGLLLHIQIWLPALAAIPVVVAALVTGSHIHTRLSDTQMQRLVGWLLLASALSVLFKAFQ
jgi:uncharacterized membrane protein YfcA